ncbi:hypothetical protein ABZ016_12945 [Streptomyces sp. NPDC006372]
MTWYQQLPEQGIEGIVAKRATSVYKAGRIWCVNCTSRSDPGRLIAV